MSRVFYADEIDLHLSLNEAIKQFIYFDSRNQCLMFNPEHKAGKNTREYKKENNEFNCEKYSKDFIEAVYTIIDRLKLPPSGYKV